MSDLLPPAADADEDLLNEAREALATGDPELTLDLCQQVLARHPDHLDARFLEAEAWRDLREAEEAEAAYERLLPQRSQDANVWAGLGAARFDLFRMDDALSAFQRALRLDPMCGAAAYGRAMVRERKEDHAGARRDYLRAWASEDAFPMPVPLSDEAVLDLLKAAVDGASEGAGLLVDHADIVLKDLPELSVCEAYDPPASPSDLLGHFANTAPQAGWAMRTPTLVLYRRNLERWAASPEAVVEALRASVLAPLEWYVGAQVEDA